MSRGGWYSQRFQPDGSLPAEGMRDRLGARRFSLLTVLVREAAQNSWDAGAGSVVDFRLDRGVINVVKLPAWRELLGTEMPKGNPDTFPLRRLIREQSIRVLAVSDRGTVGLPGATRADVTPNVDEKRNWTPFVLNSGDNQTLGAGGTYGYGKGVFFNLSRVGTTLPMEWRMAVRMEVPTRETAAVGAVNPIRIREDIRQPSRINPPWWGRPLTRSSEIAG